MNIFIDTNIFLSFLHFSKDDLEELNKLAVLLRQKKACLWLPKQVKDEFYRNRENKIADALKGFSEFKFNIPYPTLCKEYDEFEALRRHQTESQQKHSELYEKIMQDVKGNKLKADSVISKLFMYAEHIATGIDILELARARRDTGNPPGKGGSLGDALNWEALLARVPDTEPLHFITDDKDYYSLFEKEQGNPFLVSEWWHKKHTELVFYRRISSFFKSHFPDIKLADEFEKELLIQELQNSSSFARTHWLVRQLRTQQAFTSAQLNDIAHAAATNTQVSWIFEDPAIKNFYMNSVLARREIIEPENLQALDALLSAVSEEE